MNFKKIDQTFCRNSQVQYKIQVDGVAVSERAHGQFQFQADAPLLKATMMFFPSKEHAERHFGLQISLVGPKNERLARDSKARVSRVFSFQCYSKETKLTFNRAYLIPSLLKVGIPFIASKEFVTA